mgnify:CR=1 FL=1
MKLKHYFLNISKIIFFASLLYLTLAFPLIFTIYSPIWYNFNYENQEITKSISLEQRDNATDNLISFFAYNNELNSFWNEKEKIHMGEVRSIYLFLEILSIISLLLLFFTFDRSLVVNYSKINIVIISSFLILIPFFSFLFNSIFHSILFDNTFWIITPEDISYYLFPNSFFKNSFLLIIIVSIIENIAIFIFSKKYIK